MAVLTPGAADIITTQQGAYKWSGFVRVTLTGNNVLDSLVLPNTLGGQRQPDYMRIQTPTEFDQEAPVGLEAGLGAWAQYVLVGGDPVWHREDEATQGTNALWFTVTETENPGDEHIFFVEFGVEHSVDK
jgi:hypothetical protein